MIALLAALVVASAPGPIRTATVSSPLRGTTEGLYRELEACVEDRADLRDKLGACNRKLDARPAAAPAVVLAAEDNGMPVWAVVVAIIVAVAGGAAAGIAVDRESK